ncbi:Ribosome-binding protein 1 [Babesia ovata]|uniref:Ribosome-binding protein 1 n=1 Tax=Babesia ovata TaxID=189622 RepID=A0A2H6KG57_9APIC|nr:Ribosome-binding protein 1 [Babesia ovata]GBE61971.1 Ribosome-binding protein 1 [Babesia ovata]
MEGHGIPLGTLKECLQFLMWLNSDSGMQDKVAQNLEKRIDKYFKPPKFTLNNVKSALSKFLENAFGFYTRLCNNPQPWAHGRESAEQICNALLECTPKFLAVMYFLWYNVDPGFEKLHGGGWKKDWPGYGERSWHGDWGGDLDKYLYAIPGDAKYNSRTGVIPGGFTSEDKVIYNATLLDRGYPQGYSMAGDLQKIVDKGKYNYFRSVFVSSVIGESAKRPENAANSLVLARTFCDIVLGETGTDGGTLITKLEEGLNKIVTKKTICWKDLKAHCAQLKKKLHTLFNEPKRFDFTGQATGLSDLNKEALAGKAADWLRQNLTLVRGKLDKIKTDDIAVTNPNDKNLGEYFTKNFFPYGFTFGKERHSIRQKDLKDLMRDWSTVIGELKQRTGSDLERLREILNGDKKEQCKEPPPTKVPEAPKEVVPEKKVPVPKRPEGAQNQGKKAESSPTPNNGQSEGSSPTSPGGDAVSHPPSGDQGASGPRGPTMFPQVPGSPVQNTDQTQQAPPQPPPAPPPLPGRPGSPSPPGVQDPGSTSGHPPVQQPILPPVTVLTLPTSVSTSSSAPPGGGGAVQNADQDARQSTDQTSSGVANTSDGTAAGGGGGGGGSGGTDAEADCNRQLRAECKEIINKLETEYVSKKEIRYKDAEKWKNKWDQAEEQKRKDADERQKLEEAELKKVKEWSASSLNGLSIDESRQPSQFPWFYYDPYASPVDGVPLRHESPRERYKMEYRKKHAKDLAKYYSAIKQRTAAEKNKLETELNDQHTQNAAAEWQEKQKIQFLRGIQEDIENQARSNSAVAAFMSGTPIPSPFPVDGRAVKGDSASNDDWEQKSDEQLKERQRKLLLNEMRFDNLHGDDIQYKARIPFVKREPSAFDGSVVIDTSRNSSSYEKLYVDGRNEVNRRFKEAKKKQDKQESTLRAVSQKALLKDTFRGGDVYISRPQPTPPDPVDDLTDLTDLRISTWKVSQSPALSDPLDPEHAQNFDNVGDEIPLEIKHKIVDVTVDDPYSVPPSKAPHVATPVTLAVFPGQSPDDLNSNFCSNRWYVPDASSTTVTQTPSPLPASDLLPPPKTVREMLHWLVGLNESGYIPFIEDHLKSILTEYNKDVSQPSDALQVTEKPYNLDATHVSNTLTEACHYAANFLYKIKHNGNSKTVSVPDFSSEYSKLHYSVDPARLLCQLRDCVYACHHQLAFLKSQCSRNTKDGGWQDCNFGRNVSSPNSPLQAFLTDAPDSKFETHRFDPCDICLKSRINMGFKHGDLPVSQQTGNILNDILTPTCGGEDPLLTLTSYLTCITRRTPRTTGELVSFFHNFGNELHQSSPLGSALSKSHGHCPNWDCLAEEDLQVIEDLRGSAPPISIHDQCHPKTLSTLLGCGIDNVNCPQLMKPITYRAYALYSSSFVHHYLSWVVHLTDRLWESLHRLHQDLEDLQCHAAKPKPLHQCDKALPLLYTHGLTPPDGTLQPSLTCSQFIAKLEAVVSGKPIASLMTAMDTFLYRIRAPFLFTLFTLWLTATLYIAHSLLYRMDVLRLRSHLLTTRASHLIDVKALLAGSRRMLSLYRDVDYFDDDFHS